MRGRSRRLVRDGALSSPQRGRRRGRSLGRASRCRQAAQCRAPDGTRRYDAHSTSFDWRCNTNAPSRRSPRTNGLTQGQCCAFVVRTLRGCPCSPRRPAGTVKEHDYPDHGRLPPAVHFHHDGEGGQISRCGTVPKCSPHSSWVRSRPAAWHTNATARAVEGSHR